MARKIKKLKIIIAVLIAIIIILISLFWFKYSYKYGYKYGHGYKNFLMKIDTNGDEVFSKEEFLSSFETYFTQLDTNNDGSLSLREIKKMRKLFKRYRKLQW